MQKDINKVALEQSRNEAEMKGKTSDADVKYFRTKDTHLDALMVELQKKENYLQHELLDLQHELQEGTNDSEF